VAFGFGVEAKSGALENAAEVLVIQFVMKVLGFDRPMPVDHSFDATADCPTPIEIAATSVKDVAVIGASVVKPGRVIHTDAAACGVE